MTEDEARYRIERMLKHYHAPDQVDAVMEALGPTLLRVWALGGVDNLGRAKHGLYFGKLDAKSKGKSPDVINTFNEAQHVVRSKIRGLLRQFLPDEQQIPEPPEQEPHEAYTASTRNRDR